MSTDTATMERSIIGRLVDDILASGRSITPSLERGYDIEELAADGKVGMTDRRDILTEAFAGDEAHLFIHDAGEPMVASDLTVNCMGWVYLVLGNDGWDVISDYTTNLEGLGLMAGADALADRYGEEA